MVFLDSNILLELILDKRTRVREVTDYLADLSDSTAISLLSVHLVMHFGRKEQVTGKRLRSLIGQNLLLDLTAEDYDWAVTNERGSDFEDALQLAIALRNGCSTFVTLDQALARAYADLPLQIVVPH